MQAEFSVIFLGSVGFIFVILILQYIDEAGEQETFLKGTAELLEEHFPTYEIKTTSDATFAKTRHAKALSDASGQSLLEVHLKRARRRRGKRA